MLITWGLPTFYGSLNPPAGEDVDTFSPTGLDVGQWLDAIVSSGAKYAVFDAKHRQGFAMWPTSYAVPGHSPYSVAETAWYAANGSPDIVDLFVTGCRQRGLHPCLYFSVRDLTWQAWTGTDETTNAAGYIDMIETQLAELLTNYGDIYAIWFDDWNWSLGYEEIPFETLYNHIKGLQPNCIVNDNNHNHPSESEVEIYEKGYPLIPDGNTDPAEYATTVRADGTWWYFSTDDQTDSALRTLAGINSLKAAANGNNGSFLLGVTVGTDGVLPTAQVSRLAELTVP